jgi:2-polyprenyl-3-methyl-5-hydroxy-6-metoxy-1,4-benzoquinol methylase
MCVSVVRIGHVVAFNFAAQDMRDDDSRRAFIPLTAGDFRLIDIDELRDFYDGYGMAEWERLQQTAYGRLQAVIHTDFLRRHTKPGMAVLDAGAGPGRFSIELARLGARVTVLDLSAGQLSIARTKIGESGQLKSVERFVEASILDLSILADRSFDVVVCYGGPLSYVGDGREMATKELFRVLKPGCVLLTSVMSRYGATANVVRRGESAVLGSPIATSLWKVIDTGDLPPFPSRRTGLNHPAMHLYSGAELSALFAPYAEVLEVAGSNVSTFEGNSRFEEVVGDPSIWDVAVEIERRLGRQPGLVDGGSHIVLACRSYSPR